MDEPAGHLQHPISYPVPWDMRCLLDDSPWLSPALWYSQHLQALGIFPLSLLSHRDETGKDGPFLQALAIFAGGCRQHGSCGAWECVQGSQVIPILKTGILRKAEIKTAQSLYL